MPGFVDVLYKHIVPACFGAPLRQGFDLNDGNAFLVGWRKERWGRGWKDEGNLTAVCCVPCRLLLKYQGSFCQ